MTHVIITGGTIDSFFDEKQGRLSPNRHSVVMPSMKALFSTYNLRFDVLCLKDARDISESDLQKLTDMISASKSGKILVVHGFQTMADSIDIVTKKLGNVDKKIIFVGSRFPLQKNKQEAEQQISSALKQFQTIQTGVSACVDGRLLGSKELRDWRYQGKLQSEYVS